jgi:glycosyltransferase involved in cell wall biosynthesis
LKAAHTTEALPDPRANPVVSLIVCTRNRAQKLATCLARIALIEAPFAWELIVVDNNSTDDTREVVQRFIATTAVQARYLFAAEPGNGAGRNAGIAVSSGSILVFTDDDCYVEPDYLVEVMRVFSDPLIGFMSGRIMVFDPSDYPITINQSEHAIHVSQRGAVYCGLVQGANLAFRRQALVEAGLFDPNFGAGARYAGEDWELAIRVCMNGWAGGYFPGPVVQHHHGRKAEHVKQLQRFYQLGEGALYAKGLADARLRRNVAGLWIKSMARDLFRYFDLRHLVYVLIGMASYATTRLQGKLIRQPS